MNDNNSHFVGIFAERAKANEAVDRLLVSGFAAAQLSMIVSGKSARGHFGFEERKKVPEGATVGGALGVGLGALVGALAAVGAIAVPGLGLVAAGPLVAALAAAGAAGATGGILGGFIGLGFSEAEAKFFEQEVKLGNILLAVEYATDDQKTKAKTILYECEAKRVAA